VTKPRGRVVCAVLNAALDITYVGEHFAAGQSNRVGEVHAQAGARASTSPGCSTGPVTT